MILQALYRLAQDEHLMEDPDFEWRPIAWLVTVGPDGEWLGLQGTATVPSDAPAGKKAKPRAKNFLVPRESGRTSGDRAFLLFDKAEYAVGLDPEGERPAEKLAVRLGLFHARAAECFAATQDPGVRAVERFLDRRLRGEVTLTLPASCASNDLFAFVFAPDVDQLVTSRPAVRRYWQSLRAGDDTAEPGLVQCLVSGLPCSPVAKHPLLKNVPGGTSSGVALVSFNSNAFDSFGLSGNENAPVSRAASEACATALNRLLHPAFPSSVEPGVTLPRRNLRLSDTTVVCYWSARSEGTTSPPTSPACSRAIRRRSGSSTARSGTDGRWRSRTARRSSP
jgi:CRISPR-associated protein Csd1